MEIKDLIKAFRKNPKIELLRKSLKEVDNNVIKIDNVCASFTPFLVNEVFETSKAHQFIVLDNKEEAAYFYNDLCGILGDKSVLFFPSSYIIKRNEFQIDTTDVVLRTEVMDKLGEDKEKYLVVTWTDALLEKVIDKDALEKNTTKLKKGEEHDLAFLTELLFSYGFERVDFVFEPGQFSLRGGILDVFSFSYDSPIRIDFFGDKIDSIRFFKVDTQLSDKNVEEVSIVPNIQSKDMGTKISFFNFLSDDSILWLYNGKSILSGFDKLYLNIAKYCEQEDCDLSIEDFCTPSDLKMSIDSFKKIEYGHECLFSADTKISFNIKAQLTINKNFDILADCLNERTELLGENYILTVNMMQIDRINAIYKDKGRKVDFMPVKGVLHQGFIDLDSNVSVYTDHQIFERYHKYNLRNSSLKKSRDSITLKELNSLVVGDYVVHIDHGIGKFVGLQKIDVNGSEQETIRLVYRDNDVLFVGIHALHKISKYKGKEAEPPRINKLGSPAWQNLTDKTKKKVKDIARELITLYAQRKKEKAFSFAADTYMQEELEASFIYEDTPDQYKATVEIKKDMESDSAMDRLVCGDVGFGKTELAIRAAFKAVADNKQVAILVPTTVLAFQHYKTFLKRLADMPCSIEYLSRLRKPAETKSVLKRLKEGTVDIVIGTHRLVAKDIVFKDLGLLIVDEEQKFGVSVKEKLKNLKLNVDTLTLTATPIPRTLQFSLMGARDLSIMKTPPPNRYPIETELHVFDEELIAEAITYEVSRNGQVFFIHNRVNSIHEIEALIQRLVPGIRTAVGHGQMEGAKLEKTLLGFMQGDYDVLIATTIIESGLDIPNANTIIINQAQNYGLSDLHQLRGRVGRSNRKAFCYLLAPPLDILPNEAKRRLRAIESFSDLGSGFNIAMQDLDIRGAGNILGGEQSGFINDIGYESFQRILKEAMLELRETEFEDMFYVDGKVKEDAVFVTDCIIDTDKQVLIPDSYVENVEERIRLYRELDNIESLIVLDEFEQKMIDRFGTPPKNVENLFVLVRSRWIAMSLGIEKVILKNYKLVFFFIANQSSPFYESEAFQKVIRYLQANGNICEMKERTNKLSLIFTDIKAVRRIEEILKDIYKS
ncbi:MAG: transcription-repair coupling factor [Marinifilaceae bacterium]